MGGLTSEEALHSQDARCGIVSNNPRTGLLQQYSAAQDGSHLFVVDPCSYTQRRDAEGAAIIGCEVPIAGETLHFQIAVTAGQVRLADLVPAARQLGDAISRRVVERAAAEKYSIPCGRGCSACCRRYLVPVTVCEAFALTGQVLAAEPPESRRIQRRLLLAARRIMERQPPKLSFDGSGTCSDTDLAATSRWYEQIDVRCPFLEGDCCSIYAARPVACRQHFVHGSAEGCTGHSDDAERLPMPVQMADVLGLVAAELESAAVEAVPLPLIPAWCDLNAERGLRTWPAVVAAETLARTVRQAALEGMREVSGVC